MLSIIVLYSIFLVFFCFFSFLLIKFTMIIPHGWQNTNSILEVTRQRTFGPWLYPILISSVLNWGSHFCT
jgi:hypothetical protein